MRLLRYINLMKTIDVLKEIELWVGEVGEHEVERALFDHVKAPTTRYRLINGKYPNKPSDLLRSTILRVLEDNGRLKDEAS